MSQSLLAQVLCRLPSIDDRNVLVSASTADDAGVYRLSKDLALVQTVDFFTPIVDDPGTYGAIAAANALSDVFAMGGRPLIALNLLGVPTGKLTPQVIAAILRGGSRKAREAGCTIVGGHTIRNPEPIYGLAVTGTVHPRRLLTNASARHGDLLLLTKPIGTGIVTTAIKRGVSPPALARIAIASMKQLNTAGPELAEKRMVRSATDITGFGLLGHLASLCRASGVGAEIDAQAVPVLGKQVPALVEAQCVPGGTRGNLQACASVVQWNNISEPMRLLLCDAQTSGGLLLCVRPGDIAAVRRILRRHRTLSSAVIGRIIRSARPAILVR